MARFEFRLKSLATIRAAARDVRRTELADALAALHKLTERRDALERELQDQMQLCRSGTAPGQTLDVQRLLTAHRYEVGLCAQLLAIAQQEQTMAAEITARREDLLAADREVRVLEKLRERQLEQFRKQQAIAETRSLDEVAARASHHADPSV